MTDVSDYLKAIIIAAEPPPHKREDIEHAKAALETISDKARFALSAIRKAKE